MTLIDRRFEISCDVTKIPLLNVSSLTHYLIADNNRVESVYWRNATAARGARYKKCMTDEVHASPNTAKFISSLRLRATSHPARTRQDRSGVKHYSALHFTSSRTLDELFRRFLLARSNRAYTRPCRSRMLKRPREKQPPKRSQPLIAFPFLRKRKFVTISTKYNCAARNVQILFQRQCRPIFIRCVILSR